MDSTLSSATDELKREVDVAAQHCRAALKALEAADRTLDETGRIYPVHLQVAAAEMAHAIEVALQAVLGTEHSEP
jgi:hypothetical protein